jgi:hypothetical protein
MRVQRFKGFAWIGDRIYCGKDTIDWRVWRDCWEFCVNGITKAIILVGIEAEKIEAETPLGIDMLDKAKLWDILKE